VEHECIIYRGLKSAENASHSNLSLPAASGFHHDAHGFPIRCREASRFVANFIRISSPFVGVAASKLFALFIGGLCLFTHRLFTHRLRLVSWINYWYARTDCLEPADSPYGD
jgi:hypothetical protein